MKIDNCSLLIDSGLSMASSYQRIDAKENRFKYNGKELQNDLDLNWYDYGKRFYDPVVSRFIGIDPLAKDFNWVTPYNYAENYPIGAIDLWGLQKLVTTVYDVHRILQDKKIVFRVDQLGPRSISSPKGADWSGYKQNNVFFFQGKQIYSLNEIAGYKEFSAHKTTNSIRTIGKITEFTGDVMIVGGALLTPFQPEIGGPIIKGGEIVSGTGVTLQVTADFQEEKYEEAYTKLGIEALTLGLSSFGKQIINETNLDEVTIHILKSNIEEATPAVKKIIEGTVEKTKKGGEKKEEDKKDDNPNVKN